MAEANKVSRITGLGRIRKSGRGSQDSHRTLPEHRIWRTSTPARHDTERILFYTGVNHRSARYDGARR